LVILNHVLFGNQFIGVGFYCCPNKCALFVGQTSLISTIGYCILATNTGVDAVHKIGKLSKLLLEKKNKHSIIFAYENPKSFFCLTFWTALVHFDWVYGLHGIILLSFSLLGDLGIRFAGH